jgi:hypothetical protein
MKTKALLLYLLLIVPFLSISQNNDCKLRIGMNLGGISDWMTEMPFVDMMHNARTWGTRNQTGWDGPWNTEVAHLMNVDENGYPLEVPFFLNGTSLTDSQIVFTVWAYLKAWEPGIYTLFYEGEGTIEFGADGTILTSSPGMMKVSITPSEDGGFLEMKIVRSKRGNHIRNIRLIMPGHENSYTNHPFNPLYLEKLKDFKALRFMDWGSTNNWGNSNAWNAYDELSDTVLTPWEERSLPSFYTFSHNKGVPYELMCDLCNTLNYDMWVCVPHSASNEYMEEMATLIKNRLNPNLKIVVEYSNEIWNWMFGQTHWLFEFFCKGRGMEWPEGIVSNIQRNLDVWGNVFADDPSRLIKVAGGQTAWQDVSNRIVNNLRPGSFDALMVTAYFGLSEEADTELDRMGSNASAADIAYWVRKNRPEELGWIKDDYDELAKKHNVPVYYYEAGQHITPQPFGTEPTYAQALLDIQRDTALYNIYHEWFEQIKELIPNGEESLFMHFSFISSLSARYGSWGVLETLNQDTSMVYAPKYQALMEQIHHCGKPDQVGIIDIPQFEGSKLKIMETGDRSFLIESPYPISTIQVYSLKGERVAVFDVQNKNQSIFNLGHLKRGIYPTIISMDKTSTTLKIRVR